MYGAHARRIPMLRLAALSSVIAVPLAAAVLIVLAAQPASPIEAQAGGIISGNKPPLDGGFGTFAFGGGTFEQLLAASECPEETATFFYNKPDGAYAVYIPAALDVANEEIMTLFPGDSIPSGTLFTTKCISLQRVLAPIDAVDLRIAESFPPQYFLNVTSGLPSGCARFDEYEVERSGTTITVTVWNLEPAPGAGVVCTLIYGFAEHSIALGSDFGSGETYTVHVNEETTTFVAQ
jgi:hypothetical protein